MKSAGIACVHSCSQRWAPQRPRLSPLRCRADTKSSFSDTSVSSQFSKQLVSGLTALVNFVAGDKSTSIGPESTELNVQQDEAVARAPEQVLEGIRKDFTENNYLWTGKITVELYDPECSFTDPTISFTGVDTHQRNLAALSWFVDRLVSESSSELLSCSLKDDSSAVEAQWRMKGRFTLPWKPALDVTGRTVFTMSQDSSNRIVSYDEEWTIPAADALKQLITPAPQPLQP